MESSTNKNERTEVSKNDGKFAENCVPDGIFPIGDDVFVFSNTYYNSVSLHIRCFKKYGKTYYPTSEGIKLTPWWIEYIMGKRKSRNHKKNNQVDFSHLNDTFKYQADEETKHKQREELRNLREEFRRIIVPLIRRSINDRPSDITTYCARYFENLLEERRSVLSENSNQRDEFAEKEIKKVVGESNPQLQGSTSLPILTSGARLSLRETSSWSNPSDSSLPLRLWHMSYDVADTMSGIGDQSRNSTTKDDVVVEKRDKVEESGESFSLGNEASRRKDANENKNTSNDASREKQNSYLRDEICANSTSTCIDEVEQELTEIVNLASTSAFTLPQLTNRKKWSVDVGSENQVEIKSKSPDVSSGEEDDFEAYTKHHNERDIAASSSNISKEKTSFNTSLGFISHSKELDNSAAPKGDEYSSTATSKEEVENLANSVAGSIQDIIRGLNAMKLFLNAKLQKIKPLRESAKKPHLEGKIQGPPRKKRSATTFSSSDDQYKNTNTFKTKSNLPDVVLHNDIDAELARKLDKRKISDSESKTASKSSDESKLKFFAPENAGSTDCIIIPEDKASSLSNTLNRRNRTHPEESESNKLSRNNNEGIVNEGFTAEDRNEDNGLYSRNLRQYLMQNDWRQKSKYDKGYQPRKPPQSKYFPGFKIPFLSSDKNSQSSHFPNKIRQVSQTRRDSELPKIGEGGDSLVSNQRQCSVATETDTSQTAERARSIDARIRALRIQPHSEERSDPRAISKETDKMNGSHKIVDKSILRIMSTVSNADSSKVDKIEGKHSKPNDESKDELSTDSRKKSVQLPQNHSDTTKQYEGTEADLKPAKKSSSLNPCAECFNPSSKRINLSDPAKLDPRECSIENEDQVVKLENDNLSNPNLQQSTSNFPEVNVDWEYEILEDDIFLQDEDPLLFSGVPSIDSETENDAFSLSLSEIEDQDIFEREIYAAEQGLIDSTAYLREENGLLKTVNESDSTSAPNDESDECKTEEFKKRSCNLDMKMAEGDRISESAPEHSQGNNDTEEKQEEPGLSSACGDFVAAENNNAAGNREENLGEDAGNVQNADALGTILPDPPLINIENNASQNNRQDEEIELNFACFSGSDSSEVDSSDVSEGKFSEDDEYENDEQI
ncbi:uncharacterized protein NPIL_236371 [Nephila pilipes]|uniref:Uncharacterized protein n=1 Tax=Nephila pilipes TaxID=299642 RepID=A0A8X6N4L4_NEPPI|nr:uncharacterized protein NPIL_236371 [Nephila pilipes]